MAFRNSTLSNGSAGFNEPDVVVDKPAGVVDGDVLIVFFAIESAGSSVDTLAGWTPHPNNPITVTADGQRGYAFSKVASSEPASWTWTWSNGGSSGANYHCLAFSGRNTSAPITATNSGSSSTASASPRTISSSGVTAAAGDDLVFLQFLDNTAAATLSYSPPAGFTEATDVSDSLSFTSSAVAYKENVSSGATGTISGTGTYSAGNAGYGAFLYALAKAPTSGAVLEAAASDTAAASAALTTQIRAAAAATDSAAASGALTTAIRLAAAAVDSASASAIFASGALLNAAATDVATAVGALTTAIRANGAAVDVAVATGALTNWSTVTLSGTLYTGQGGVLDPNFWVDAVPGLGTTLYYDATHIAISPNGEISADTNNCTAVVQFFDGTSWALGLIVVTPQLAAVAVSSASAAAQLTTAIRLAAAASALATATGAFSTGAGLTAAASDTASASGGLTTQVPLSALAADVVTAVGALSTQIRLAATATSNATASGNLNGVITLNAAANAIAAAVGALTTGIPVGAIATDAASATGSLTASIRLSGAAQSVVQVAGALSTSIALGGAASNAVSASGDLKTARLLVAAAVDAATAVAMISTGIRLNANAEGIARATADLTGSVRLLADASSQSTATAEITDVIQSPPIGAHASDPRFNVSKQRWSFFESRSTDRFSAKDPLESVVLTFDLGAVLANDEYLSGPITLTIAATSGSDASPRTLLVGVPSYDMTKRKILQPVHAGIDGNTYYVKVAAATNVANRVVALAGLLPVRG